MNQLKLGSSIVTLAAILLTVYIIATNIQYVKAQSESANAKNEIKSIVSTSNPVLNITSVPNYYTGISHTFTDPTTIPPGESSPFEFPIGNNDVTDLALINSYKLMVSGR
jgi:hypothetical protein